MIFTKEDIELSKVSPLLDLRHDFLRRVVEAAVEGKPHRDLLLALELIGRKIEESGYKGDYLDEAAYATAVFESEDDIPFA